MVTFHPASWYVFITITAAAALPLAGQSAPLLPQRPSPENSISFVYRSVNFRYARSDSAAASIDFTDHALGVRFTTPQWRGIVTFSFEFGGQDRGADSAHPSVHFFDFQATNWTRHRLLGRHRVQLDGSLVALLSYRRFGFGASTVGRGHVGRFAFGLGLGLVFSARMTPHLVLNARSGVLADVALRGNEWNGKTSLRDFAVSLSSDSDVSIRWARGVSRLGFVLGAGLRVAHVPIAAEKLFPGTTRRWFPYHTTESVLRFGLSI